MLIRALALLIVLIGVSLGLSFWFGAEVLAALGAVIAQLKVIIARTMAISSQTILVWLKAQGLNFARVELAKRWFLKSLVPMLIGAANQRRIANFVQAYTSFAKARFGEMMDWYRALPRPTRYVLILVAMSASLALALTTMSLWLLLFSVQLPMWIIAGFAAFGQLIWQTVQKTVFRTLAFMQLFRAWDFLRGRVPPAYLQRLRRFNFRIARIVVRKRRMTVAQLHDRKGNLGLRWALLLEYFRHARPETPTRAEMDALHHPEQGR
ncbi:MAG: hypothetical protein AAF813_05260 [Pseudomonadota bacterium]